MGEIHKQQVTRFYEVIWNAHDLGAIGDLLHEDFEFRGSLGQRKRGHRGFAEYVDGVHRALGDYQCRIDDLVAEGARVFARMTFSGIHRGDFLGYSPTGMRVSWAGCALFTFRGERIAEAWVLGDLHGLETELRRQRAAFARAD